MLKLKLFFLFSRKAIIKLNYAKFRFMKIFVFAKIQNFRENIGIPKCLEYQHFCKMLTKIFVFKNIFLRILQKIWNFRERYIFQTFSRAGCLVQITYMPTYLFQPASAVLSQLSGPGCHFQDILS